MPNFFDPNIIALLPNLFHWLIHIKKPHNSNGVDKTQWTSQRTKYVYVEHDLGLLSMIVKVDKLPIGYHFQRIYFYNHDICSCLYQTLAMDNPQFHSKPIIEHVIEPNIHMLTMNDNLVWVTFYHTFIKWHELTRKESTGQLRVTKTYNASFILPHTHLQQHHSRKIS